MCVGGRYRNYSFQPGLYGGGTFGNVTLVILIRKNSIQLASTTIFQKTILWNSLPMSGTFKALREIQKLFLSLEVYQLIAYQMASEDSGIETSPINSEMLTT